MPINVVRKDITKIKADAIVSASGHSFATHGAVSSAIFKAAGPGLQEACDRKGYLDTAEVLVTEAYGLPAKFVIHTVGPSWEDGHHGEEVLLRVCYENCLKAAWEKDCRSIAFPLISSGGYHFPKEHALSTAMEAIAGYEHFDEMDVTLAVFDRKSFIVNRALEEDISRTFASMFSDASVVESCKIVQTCEIVQPCRMEKLSKGLGAGVSECLGAGVPEELANQLKYLDESFAEMLNRLIYEKNMKPSEIYGAANVSRAVFSNIFNKKGYLVKKETALSLAIALKLDMEETKLFIGKAGHALSDAFKQDKVVEYFISHRKYNIYEINEVLFAYDLPLLFSREKKK